MKKQQLFCLAVAMTLLLAFLLPSIAYAEGNNNQTDTAGNQFVTGTAPNGTSFGRDVFYADTNSALNTSQVAGNAFLAGSNVSLTDTTVGGSFFGAGQNVNTSKTTVTNNIFVAGNGIIVDKETKAAAIYACGNTLTIDGSANYLAAAGSTVTLNGHIEGDAVIDAASVIIGDNAEVTGTLKVTTAQEPKVPESASIGKLQFVANQTDEDTAKEAESQSASNGIGYAFYWIIATIALALILCLIMGDAINDASAMTRTKPVILFLSGFIAFLAFPVLAIILCFTIIGLPIVGMITGSYVIVLLGSAAFAGAALGRCFLPKLNPWLAAIIGAGAISLVKAIPILGGLVGFAAMLFTLGWLIQTIWVQLKKATTRKPKDPTPDGDAIDVVANAPKDLTEADVPELDKPVETAEEAVESDVIEAGSNHTEELAQPTTTTDEEKPADE